MPSRLEDAARCALRMFLNVIRVLPDEAIRGAYSPDVAEAVLLLRDSAPRSDQNDTGEWERRTAAASRMADKIIEISKDSGECTEDDLCCAGFSPAEIADLKRLAMGFVAVRMPPHKTLN